MPELGMDVEDTAIPRGNLLRITSLSLHSLGRQRNDEYKTKVGPGKLGSVPAAAGETGTDLLAINRPGAAMADCPV